MAAEIVSLDARRAFDRMNQAVENYNEAEAYAETTASLLKNAESNLSRLLDAIEETPSAQAIIEEHGQMGWYTQWNPAGGELALKQEYEAAAVVFDQLRADVRQNNNMSMEAAVSDWNEARKDYIDAMCEIDPDFGSSSDYPSAIFGGHAVINIDAILQQYGPLFDKYRQDN